MKDFGLQINPLKALPESSGRRGPRASQCLEIVEAAEKSDSGIVSVEMKDQGDREKLDKLYRSMMQWKNRHAEKKVNVRKDGPTLYVWVEKPKP